jgi:hypothetical protein
VILKTMRGVQRVLTRRNPQRRVEIFVQPPVQVVAIRLVFLNTQNSRFVRIVPQSLRRQRQLIEPAPVTFSGLHEQRARQQANPVGVIHGAAVHVFVAAGRLESIPQLERLLDVVARDVGAARAVRRFVGWRHRRLGPSWLHQ